MFVVQNDVCLARIKSFHFGHLPELFIYTVCLVLSMYTSDRPGAVVPVEDDACVGGGPVRGLPHHPLYHQTIEEGFIQKANVVDAYLGDRNTSIPSRVSYFSPGGVEE